MAGESYFSGGDEIPLKRSTKFKAFKINIDPGLDIASGDPGALQGNVKRDKNKGIKLVEIQDGAGELGAAGAGHDEIEGDELFVYEDESLGNAVLTYEFIVKFKDDASITKINEIILNDRFEFEKRSYGKNIYLGRIKNKADYQNLLNLINEIKNKDSVEFAHPNFTSYTNLLSFPESERFDEQWALNSPGIDIDVKAVWNDLNIKGAGIKIAIIDVGVDVDHEDLMKNGQRVKGFDTINSESNTYRDDPSPMNGDSHGTCCAGIAAANGKNTAGICGVAPESEIIAIRVASEGLNRWITDANEIAHGIYKAIELKVDVISNSFYHPRSDLIIRALEDAKTKGRERVVNGQIQKKGCVIICASGNYIKGDTNDSLRVTFPANQSRLAIAVGACNELGNWVGDRDIERWASKYGAELKICAPGFNILATNYYEGDGEGQQKYRRFDGTSAATPIVAGVAALILCANKNLTSDEVEQILLTTADPINSDDPLKIGHGKVNARAAVNRALGN